MAGNEVGRCFHIKSGVKKVCGLSIFIWIISMDFVLGSTEKTMGEHEINGGKKTLLGLDCADDLTVFDTVNGKMNDCVDISRARGARIGLTFNGRSTKSLKLGKCEVCTG